MDFQTSKILFIKNIKIGNDSNNCMFRLTLNLTDDFTKGIKSGHKPHELAQFVQQAVLLGRTVVISADSPFQSPHSHCQPEFM